MNYIEENKVKISKNEFDLYANLLKLSTNIKYFIIKCV